MSRIAFLLLVALMAFQLALKGESVFAGREAFPAFETATDTALASQLDESQLQSPCKSDQSIWDTPPDCLSGQGCPVCEVCQGCHQIAVVEDQYFALLKRFTPPAFERLNPVYANAEQSLKLKPPIL